MEGNQVSLRSIRVFMIGYLLLLAAFFVWGGIIAAIWWEEFLTKTPGLIYIMFAIQQILTLLILRWSISESGKEKIDDAIAYFWDKFDRHGRWPMWKRVIGWLIGYLVINGALFRLVERLGIQIPGLYGEQGVMEILADMNLTSTLDWLFTILMIVIVWPIVEELVYRGLVTDTLMQRRRRRGVALAAFIFALIHLEFAVFRNLFLLALILWVIYYKTKSLRYTIAFHMMINGLGLLWLRVQQNVDLEALQAL